MVDTQLNTFTPVGTAMVMVAYMKNSSPATGIPTVNMWCAQTMKRQERDACGGVHHGGVAEQRLAREGRDRISETTPKAGRIMMYTSG